MSSKTQLIRRFHGLMASLNIMGQKETLVGAYGKESTKDLTAKELTDLIERLQLMTREQRSDSVSMRSKRSIVLTILQSLGVYSDNRDWGRVNAYLMNPRIAGKLLYEMDEKELTKLAIKLRVVLKKKNDQKAEIDYLALNN